MCDREPIVALRQCRYPIPAEGDEGIQRGLPRLAAVTAASRGPHANWRSFPRSQKSGRDGNDARVAGGIERATATASKAG